MPNYIAMSHKQFRDYIAWESSRVIESLDTLSMVLKQSSVSLPVQRPERYGLPAHQISDLRLY